MSKPWFHMICDTCGGRGYCEGIGQRHVDCTDCNAVGGIRILPEELEHYERHLRAGYSLWIFFLDPTEKIRKGERRVRNSRMIRQCHGGFGAEITLYPVAEMLDMVSEADCRLLAKMPDLNFIHCPNIPEGL